MMLFFAAVPSAPRRSVTGRPVPHDKQSETRSAFIGMAAGLLIALGGIVISVYGIGTYGAAVFLGVPVLAASVTAFLYNKPARRTQRATDGVVMYTLILIGGTMLLFAMEGVVCLVMAIPIAVILALLGSRVGRMIALASPSSPAAAAMILFLPAGLLADRVTSAHGSPTIEVVTTVDVAAPPLAVWKNVVEFHEIPAPSEWYFRAGLAYPVRATISGTGVGATRRCVFSTGAFIEPITIWEPGRILAFGVTAQPQPLEEWSPYRRVYAPHLNGFFVSERGEFRLIPLANGGTRLEGHTWYHNNMYPQSYWRLFSDPILHRIHARVLDEVKRDAEASPGVQPAAQ
jgi:hypothetical protein